MSDVNNEVKQGADSLAPIKDKDRIMGWGSYLMLWLGGMYFNRNADHGFSPAG